MRSSEVFARVLAAPGSIAARRELLAAWQAEGDPRAELLAAQLAYRDLVRSEGARSDRAHALDGKIDDLVHARGREFAGPIADLVDEYHFRRGLVTRIVTSGPRFLAHAKQLFELAPLERVEIVGPLGDLEAIVNEPLVGRLASLGLSGHEAAFGDRGAAIVAASTALGRLAYLDLWYDGITRAGVEAIAASPQLASVSYLGFEGNPCDPTPWARVDELDLPITGRPPIAAELERQFGPRAWLATPAEAVAARWPPHIDELRVVD